MADPTNGDLVSFINQGFKPGDLDRVGRTLRAEIQERADQTASLSGSLASVSGSLNTVSGSVYTTGQVNTLLDAKAALSGATFTGPVVTSGTFRTASGVFISGLINAADDTAAQASGVAVNQLYRTGSAIKVRVV